MKDCLDFVFSEINAKVSAFATKKVSIPAVLKPGDEAQLDREKPSRNFLSSFTRKFSYPARI